MSAAQIKEMMDNWNSIEAEVRARYPESSENTVYEITKSLMNKSLGL